MEYIQKTDNDLVRLAKDGDIKAYERLLSRYYPQIQQIIRFNIQEQEQVFDLTQEILLKIFCYLPHFEEKSSFSTWLYRMVQNTIKNHYRANHLRYHSENEYATSHPLLFYGSPEYQIMNLELEELVEQALSQVSEEVRLCYGMHVFEGHTYETIAHRMHCPIGTVRSRIFRARKLIIARLRGSI